MMVLGLMVVSGLASQNVAPQACTFVQQFEKAGRSATRLSFQERVLYSLIEAKDQGCKSRAPG